MDEAKSELRHTITKVMQGREPGVCTVIPQVDVSVQKFLRYRGRQ